MLGDLHDAHHDVKGTIYYGKYYMECYANTYGVWKYIGCRLPDSVGKIKVIEGETYITTMNAAGTKEAHRYKVTSAVKELLNI